jgi:hypothetical protein
MNDIYVDVFTVRLSKRNKPVHALLSRVASEKGISTNKLIEQILVKSLRARGISWDEPSESEPVPDNQLDMINVIKEVEGE